MAKIHCTFASVIYGLEKSLSTTLITESNKIYSDIFGPHMYPTFIFFCDTGAYPVGNEWA